MSAREDMENQSLSNAKIVALEQRYIELLERKIESLEVTSQNVPLGSSPRPPQVRGRSISPTGRLTASTTIPTIQATDTKLNLNNGETSQPISRIRFMDKRFTTEGLQEVRDATANITQAEHNVKETAHAMTILRQFDDKDKYDSTTITIEDEGLLCLMLHALAYHPWYIHAEQLHFVSLFEPIIHTWSVLNALAANDRSNSVVRGLYENLQNPKDSQIFKTLAVDNILERAMQDLGLFLEQVKLTPGLQSYFNGGREMQEKIETVTFEYLWTLFPPGELVYSAVYMKKPQIFIVKSCTDFISTRRAGKKMLWEFDCWTYDLDGTEFNRIPVEFSFEDFKGNRSITSLHCYPLKYHKEDDEEKSEQSFQEKLITRGRRYCELCLKRPGSQIFEYDGYALSRGSGIRQVTKSNSQDDESDARSSRELGSIRGRESYNAPAKKQIIKKDFVMVDFGSYVQHGPPYEYYPPMGDLEFTEDDGTCQCALCAANMALRASQKPHYDHAKNTDGFEDTQYLICPPRVLGYHLNGKRWVELDVRLVSEIEHLTDASSFRQLELNPVQKELIKKLVKSHASGTEKTPFMRDLMKGKGNGLVILLHGPPGVGKTLTAESVAKVTGKPLFSVSVSDIGLKPAEVENNLEVIFELAATWRAVLLFDEADVFLESRSSHTSNLDRNALVSVLLRVLEYYDGILILTTNRIRTFDIAVQSRVNFAITYKNLDDKQKKNIYQNFIEQLTDDNCQNKHQLLKWLDEEDNVEAPPFKRLNGRQIRNVLFSAASVASGEGDGRLKLEHIKKILRETQKFQEDINNMVESARKEAEVDYARNM
ncbi:hypothetical protein MMC27_006412 [Xylographa pallens]|nr:hypothetical protein [Xylographa pallens]